ncbi:hypothetical protein HMPREF3034_00009 [Prevotella sp. DNF00663]|nr:hypothetical protein HMPREF3034_00009 [Prevotella sp. DNF00663]
MHKRAAIGKTAMQEMAEKFLTTLGKMIGLCPFFLKSFRDKSERALAVVGSALILQRKNKKCDNIKMQ